MGRGGHGAAAEEALVKIEAVLPDKNAARARSVQVHAMTGSEMTDVAAAPDRPD